MNMIKYVAVLLALYGNFENVDAMYDSQREIYGFFSSQDPQSDYSPVEEMNYFCDSNSSENYSSWEEYFDRCSDAEYNLEEENKQLQYENEKSEYCENMLWRLSPKAQKKVVGNDQFTSPGHASGMEELTEKYANDDSIEKVFRNKSLRTITGGKINSRLRPDIACKRYDGKYTLTEIRSPSESPEEQRAKLSYMYGMNPDLFDENRQDLYNCSDFTKTSPYRPNERRKLSRLGKLNKSVKLDRFSSN